MSISTNFTEILPELAQEYLSEKHHYPFNRKINRSHVLFLSKAMINGYFQPTSQIAFACHADKRYLINGQHTLSAIIESGKSQKLCTITYEVENFNKIHPLFNHFDIGTSRTFSDSVRTLEVSKKTGLTSTQINRLSSAIKYMKNGFPLTNAKNKFHNEELIDMVYKWSEEGLQVFNAISGGEKKVSRRLTIASALSVLIIIMKYNPDKAKSFISQVAKDDGLKMGDPRKALNRYLNDADQTRGSSDVFYNGQISRSCAKAWNKYIKKVEVKAINVKVQDASKNIVIESTPYTGKFSTS